MDDLLGMDLVPTMLTIAQTAARLGVKGNHVTRLIETGKLEAIDLALDTGKGKRCLRISEASVLSLIESRRIMVGPITPARSPRSPQRSGQRQYC